MEKSTKTTITLFSIFLLVGGVFFVYATGRLESLASKMKNPSKTDNDNDNVVNGRGLIPPINDFPLKKGKRSSKEKVKILQKYINYKIWGISLSNQHFIDVDGVYGKDTKDAIVKYLGIDPIITETKFNQMRNVVIEIERKKPNFF